MNEVLQKYPDTPLRDMALFWLSRSYYKAGNQQEAARYLSQFSKEFPDNPLRNTVEDELISLTARYEKGEKLPGGAPLATPPDQLAAQKARAEKERIAAAKAEEAKLAAAESARVAGLKLAEEKAAAEKKELERVAAAKAEQDRLAATKTEASLRAEAAAEAARIAARKAESERLAKAQADRERVAQAEAELTRTNALKAEKERKAATEKAERERIALAKAEEAKRAAAAESARLASLKAEEKAKAAKLAYREKAIGQYKAIIDKFPASSAAVTAAAKLRELGVAVALPPQKVEAPLPENAQVLRLEVAQFAGFEFNLLSRPDAFAVGRTVSIPFEVINRGNGNDSFYLESAFPADFKARFASVAAPGTAISQTPDPCTWRVF